MSDEALMDPYRRSRKNGKKKSSLILHSLAESCSIKTSNSTAIIGENMKKMMQCIQCARFISALSCKFGCPHCGYSDG